MIKLFNFNLKNNLYRKTHKPINRIKKRDVNLNGAIYFVKDLSNTNLSALDQSRYQSWEVVK